VDQTKPKNKIVCRHKQERRDDSNLDCAMYLFASCFYKVPIKTKQEHATDFTVAAIKFV